MKIYSSLIATLVIGTMVFTGCTPASIQSQSQTQTETETQTQTDEEGVQQLIMATNAAFPPYEYYEGGKIVGIDAEIAEKIAEKLGMELVIEDMEFGSIIAAVKGGKADIALAGMTVTEDRLFNINFSDSYATGYQVIIVQEGSDITDADDLADKSIGVQENTTGDIYISDDYTDADIQRYNKGADAVQALIQGKVDAVVIDREPALSFVALNEGLVILPTEYVIEEYAIAVGKENTELLEKINIALSELKEDGTIQSILDKYISTN